MSKNYSSKNNKKGGDIIVPNFKREVNFSTSIDDIAYLCKDQDTLVTVHEKQDNEQVFYLGEIGCRDTHTSIREMYAKAEYCRLLMNLGINRDDALSCSHYMYNPDYEFDFAVSYLLNEIFPHFINDSDNFSATSSPVVLRSQFIMGILSNSPSDIDDICSKLTQSPINQLLSVYNGEIKVAKFITNEDGSVTAQFDVIDPLDYEVIMPTID